VWQQSPHWRNYFATETIDLDLPLLDEKDRPLLDAKGNFKKLVRCTREIFLRRHDFDLWLATLSKSDVNSSSTKRASERQIREAFTRYCESLGGATSSQADFVSFARDAGLRGHRKMMRAIHSKKYPRRPGRPAK
jgi:hypothetical protein